MPREERVRRLALLLEYDGTAYGGSQYQKNAPTVQGTLERALSRLTGEPIRVGLAGRTDAGVHARGQVASFLTASRHDTGTFVRGTNALLPADVSVQAAAEVPREFNPRRQAIRRWYRYVLYLRPQRSALMRNRAWHVGQALDLEAISQAAQAMTGRHDFAAFAPPSEAKRGSTEREVFRAEVTPKRGTGVVHFDIEANAFLQRMVRRAAGALVEVGLGKRTAAEFRELVEIAESGAAKATAPAKGLCLMKVCYESGLFDAETNEDI
jgi:tRNA pseudouridine38-40 synthase